MTNTISPQPGRILPLVLICLTLVLGCSQSVSPPTPIALEELPGALEKTFSTAKSPAKDLATQICAALKAQDHSKAFFLMQELSRVSQLNKEQTTLLARGVLCMNTTLQSAQSKGDQKAAEALRLQRATK